jgi:DNA-binding CsgD family transcriptional regulator
MTSLDPNFFSKREKDTLQCLLQGKSNKQIALELGISERTVEFHLGNIYAKLGVASRSEAIVKLAGSSLWDSTGIKDRHLPEESPVANTISAVDNDHKSFSIRRLLMKNPVYPIGAVLLLTALILIFVFVQPPAPDTQETPTLTADRTSTVDLLLKTSVPTAIETAPSLPQTSVPTIIADTLQDSAHFVGENYPDGSIIPLGTSFTKTWKLQNTGTTTWTSDYKMVTTQLSGPLGSTLGEESEINLPHEVPPGSTIELSANLVAPQTAGIYEVHYQFLNADGVLVSGDGNTIWLKVTIGSSQLSSNSALANNVTLQLMGVEKYDALTNVEICSQLPDTQDWNPNGVVLSAGNVQNSLSGYMLKNPKQAATYASSYRCYILEFPVGVRNYGSAPISVSISNIRVPAENNLEANCARAKQILAQSHPGLDFTCGPIGFYYTNPKLPPNLSKADADRIIMDALEQAIYGYWILSE